MLLSEPLDLLYSNGCLDRRYRNVIVGVVEDILLVRADGIP